MALKIHTLVLGPLENNTYLVAEEHSREAAIIDPSFDITRAVDEIRKNDYNLTAIWLTHAHFDHLAGLQELQTAFDHRVPTGLHPSDLPLWYRSGDAAVFGYTIKPGQKPQLHFNHRQVLTMGKSKVEVRHTPGHSAGHVVFYSAEAAVVFCGDLIFQMGIGRTDLPGGDYVALLDSIQTQILTLPPDTRLLSGHGPETTVAAEYARNPYIHNLQKWVRWD
jgi:hydroxyacylglutathione hydrolase